MFSCWLPFPAFAASGIPPGDSFLSRKVCLNLELIARQSPQIDSRRMQDYPDLCI